MSRLRVLRAVWPLLFIVPLWVILRRLCWSQPAHLMLHATMRLHEELPVILGAAALVSIGVVVLKLVRVNAGLKTLQAVAGSMPVSLRDALTAQAALLHMPEPQVTYLDVDTPICYTVVPGPSILVSRGFIDELDETGLALVVRHELTHVRRRDPQRALLWHLVFSALLVPGFAGLERWLYNRRERRTNEVAGTLADVRFKELTSRVRRAEMSLERSLGNAYAGALRPQYANRFVFVRPALALIVFSALVASHVVFMSALPSLERYHC